MTKQTIVALVLEEFKKGENTPTEVAWALDISPRQVSSAANWLMKKGNLKKVGSRAVKGSSSKSIIYQYIDNSPPPPTRPQVIDIVYEELQFGAASVNDLVKITGLARSGIFVACKKLLATGKIVIKEPYKHGVGTIYIAAEQIKGNRIVIADECIDQELAKHFRMYQPKKTDNYWMGVRFP